MKAIQQRFTGVLSIVIMITGTACVASPTVKSPVSVQLDWPTFMARQDLIWEILPTHFDYGAFMGNGMLGSMIYQDGPQRLRWEMGRSDVTEHRRDNARLPIGGLVLTTIGKIEDGTMRLEILNFDEPDNEHFIQDFLLDGGSAVSVAKTCPFDITRKYCRRRRKPEKPAYSNVGLQLSSFI